MCREGAGGFFGDITTMDIRGNELELRPPLLLDVELVGCAAFFVRYLEVDTMAALCEANHDPICGGKAVVVVARFEWIHQDYIGVQMVGDNNEVFAASGANQEPAHVISVKLAGGFRFDVEFL